jgi:hypothetical protein
LLIAKWNVLWRILCDHPIRRLVVNRPCIQSTIVVIVLVSLLSLPSFAFNQDSSKSKHPKDVLEVKPFFLLE